MSREERLLSTRVLERCGKTMLAELDLMLGLVVQLEPWTESDHCGQSVSSPARPNVDPNNVNPLRSLVWGLNPQPTYSTARLDVEVLAPPW